MRSALRFLSVLTFTLSGVSQAAEPLVSPKTAKLVAGHVEAFGRPGPSASPFLHWVFNTASQTALQCWRAAQLPDAELPSFGKGRPTAAGVYRQIEQARLPAVCNDLANRGIDPVCVRANLFVNARRDTSLPLEYVQLDHPDQLREARGQAYCHLTRSYADQQSYQGDVSLEWTVPPSRKEVMTPNGARVLNVGTVLVSAPPATYDLGAGFRLPKTVVIADQ